MEGPTSFAYAPKARYSYETRTVGIEDSQNSIHLLPAADRLAHVGSRISFTSTSLGSKSSGAKVPEDKEAEAPTEAAIELP